MFESAVEKRVFVTSSSAAFSASSFSLRFSAVTSSCVVSQPPLAIG